MTMQELQAILVANNEHMLKQVQEMVATSKAKPAKEPKEPKPFAARVAKATQSGPNAGKVGLVIETGQGDVFMYKAALQAILGNTKMLESWLADNANELS